MVRDREQPRERRASPRAVTRQRRQRRGESLRRQVGGELAVARAAQEEREHRVDAPSIEAPKRLRVAPAGNEKRLVSILVIRVHNQYIVNTRGL